MKPQAISMSLPAEQIQHITRMRLLMLGFLATLMLLAQVMAAQARPESLAPLADQISPSVVNITTSTVVEGRTSSPTTTSSKARTRF